MPDMTDIFERRRAEEQAWRDALPEPLYFIPSEDDPQFGIGFWNGGEDGGAFICHRYSNGFAMRTAQHFDRDFIEKLARAAGLLE